MTIEHKTITIREISEGYADNEEEGVVGFGGKLNIRPPYQREFVYKDRQRDAVVETIRRGFPLNVMYWAKNADGTLEVLDGQQRTISFCQYVNGDFSVPNPDGNPMYFHSLTEDERNQILDYAVDVYVCEGSDRERLDWFRTINIAGERLTDQELLNVNYTGPWLADAKRRFSKSNCVAYRLASKFVKGVPIRQEYLETALGWISGGDIAGYMNEHKNDVNANELWLHFSNVVEWAKATFDTERNYRREMLGLDWGRMYSLYHGNTYDSAALERCVKELMENEEVTDKRGIYEYVLSGEDESIARRLSRRTFSQADKRTTYERQGGVCPKCGRKYDFSEMHGDHIVPWWRGGATVLENCQMLCEKCNTGKGGRME